MATRPLGAERFIPSGATSLSTLRAALDGCRGCELHRNATQGVFGAGSAHATLLLIGEQPGDREDLEGQPFVGPAGRVLDEALEEAGIARDAVYLTNAVKHFKFEQRGKRRLHQRPTRGEVTACKPWLEREIELVSPEVIVLLGATAAQALMGASFRITKQRGELLDVAGTVPRRAIATWHPSAVLRQRDPEDRARQRAELVSDLRAARDHLS